MKAEGHKFQDLEETCNALLDYIKSSQFESLIKVKEEHQLLFDVLDETQSAVAEMLKDMAQVEETVAQSLLDLEREKEAREEGLVKLEKELKQSTAKSQITDSEIEFLQREIEMLRSSEDELEGLRNEVQEDTTEVIPSAIYVAKLFYLITKIKWEYDTEPHVLKGVHYGAELARPISFDTSVMSRKEVSDQLWSLISQE
ncbi:kinetochore protein Spc24 [Synchiropus splendidus]|uniref:kinetochore protein Spc24 n=1 Tax=Synchiropus splendidus TaxID=270530 RepID=UPI00237DF916|nr:kinetochore protein Spc24 [Synchiropus splendidus]